MEKQNDQNLIFFFSLALLYSIYRKLFFQSFKFRNFLTDPISVVTPFISDAVRTIGTGCIPFWVATPPPRLFESYSNLYAVVTTFLMYDCMDFDNVHSYISIMDQKEQSYDPQDFLWCHFVVISPLFWYPCGYFSILTLFLFQNIRKIALCNVITLIWNCVKLIALIKKHWHLCCVDSFNYWRN